MDKPTRKPQNRTETDPNVHRVGGKLDAKYFNTHEFACNDGTPIFLIDRVLLFWLDYLRDQIGPIRINSGFRTACYNEKIGGADQSRHRYGLAADVVAMNEKPEKVAEWAESQDFGGIGRYSRFTHLDVWSENRRWDNR